MQAIIAPKELRRLQAVSLANSLWTVTKQEVVVLDWQNVSWVEPFALVYLATEIRRFRQQRGERSCVIRNYRPEIAAHTYAAHMGFFESCGLNIGNKPGEAKGNKNYLPVTFLPVEDLYEIARKEMEEIGQAIEIHSRRLAKILTRMDSGELVETLTYSLREIIRNVAEHSKSEIVGYCAQYWPSRQEVELAVIDTGMGVRKALSENPNFRVEDDRHALHLALLPGVSGKAWRRSPKGYDPEYDSVWKNSGFGLYMTSRLCADGGSFYISSGNSGLLISESQKFDFDTNFHGTAIRLVMRTERQEKIKQLLMRLSSEGSPIARQITKGEVLTASVASKMLSEDFRLRRHA